MIPRPLAATAFVAGSILVASLTSRSAGVIPGFGGIPANVTKALPSCGTCHQSFAQGAQGVRVQSIPSDYSIALGGSVSITTSLSGGVAGTRGGFAGEASAGAFSAGTGSRTDATGQFVTHANPLSRTWTYGYTAPTTAGVVELTWAGNAVNGNGNNGGDTYALHGFDGTASFTTPVRLIVNAAGNVPFGASCAGSFENVPVLGSTRAPVLGNANFAHLVVGANVGVTGAMNYGFRRASPLDLSIIGATGGCFLLVDGIASQPLVTAGANGQAGDGRALIPLPIANNPAFRGIRLDCQVLLLDGPASRSLKLTATNGVSTTIQ